MTKFVTFRDKDGREWPVIFPDWINHNIMAEAVQDAVRMTEVRERERDFKCPKPVAAGFVYGLTVASAAGSSESLGLGCRAGETDLINGKRGT